MIYIDRAIYGGKDVKEIVEKEIIKNSFFKISNELFGDPDIGNKKSFTIEYTIEDDYFTDLLNEGDFFSFNKPKKNLAIYYTNNQDEDLIKLTLGQIEKSINDCDVVICGKNEIKSSFYFVKSKINNQGHFSICSQILQCLLLGQKLNKNYKKVFFLEHDVLYPRLYFNFDSENNIDCNQNYIGLNKKGWQVKEQNHQPLHQLVMDFSFAINHFKNLHFKYLNNETELLEPQVKIINYNSKNPCVHINHGANFTSHFSIYSDYTEEFNEYWGYHKGHY